MTKLLAICAALLAHAVYSEQETILVKVYDVQSMYNNECKTSTSTSTSSAPGPASDAVKESDYEYEYDKYENYGKKYADQYGGGGGDETKWSDKYQHEYQGKLNPGSVKGNEIGGDSYEQSDAKESAAFCKCLDKVAKEGKSYAASQDDISRCIDKTNGNDAKHWEKVSERYGHKYGIKTDSWDGPLITTTAVSSDSAEGLFIADAGAPALAGGAAGNVGEEGGDEDALLPKEDGRFGNAAVYITFIGTSVLLFICAWFVKDGMKKWKLREYQTVKQGSSYESEADADSNGNPYGGSYDDWDDDHYASHQKGSKNNKFASWNQYHAV
jgi:hypothetical protein